MGKHCDEFYINCCLKEDINSPNIWIYNPYLPIIPPYDIVKIICSGSGKKCYVKARNADSSYLSRFREYLKYSKEIKLFEDAKDKVGTTPIIFLSEYYRRILEIDICVEVMNPLQYNKNIKTLCVYTPSNGISYLFYLCMSAITSPDILVRFNSIISFLLLFIAIPTFYKGVNFYISLTSFILFLISIFIINFSKIISIILFIFSISIIIWDIPILCFIESLKCIIYNCSNLI